MNINIVNLAVFWCICCASLGATDNSYLCVPCEEPCGCNDAFKLRFDLLYWTPRVSGLEWGFGRTEIDETVVDCTQILSTEEVDCDPKFKWSPGLRVGAGWECDDWGVGAFWTHFNGNAGKHSRVNENVFNNGKVRVYLDQIDLAFSFYGFERCSFSFVPFIGLRATNIREKIHANSSIEITLNPNVLTWENRTFHDKQDYWGAGPLFGFKGNWTVGCGVDLYGLLAGSLLYGKYEVRWDDSDIFSGGISKQIYSKNKKHVRGFDYNLDFGLGINWNVWTCGTRAVNMTLGFEHHQYWNQSRLCDGRGDISFTGLLYDIEFRF